MVKSRLRRKVYRDVNIDNEMGNVGVESLEQKSFTNWWLSKKTKLL